MGVAQPEYLVGAAAPQHVDLRPLHHLEYLAHTIDGAAVVVLADADADEAAVDDLGEEGEVAPLLQLVARQAHAFKILSGTMKKKTISDQLDSSKRSVLDPELFLYRFEIRNCVSKSGSGPKAEKRNCSNSRKDFRKNPEKLQGF